MTAPQPNRCSCETIPRVGLTTIVLIAAFAGASGATTAATPLWEQIPVSSYRVLVQAAPAPPQAKDAPPTGATAPRRLPAAPPARNEQTRDENKRYRILTDRLDEKPRPIEGGIDPNNTGGAQNHN
jgi:hypothetical protein